MRKFFSRISRLINLFLAHPVWTFLGTAASFVAIWLTVEGVEFRGSEAPQAGRSSMTFANDGLRHYERIKLDVVDGFVVGTFVQGEYDSGNQVTYRFRSTSPFNTNGFLVRFEGNDMPYTPPFTPLNVPQSPPFHWRIDDIGHAPELVVPERLRNYVTMEWENGETRYAIQR